MGDKKYNKVLTVVLVITAIVILIILGFWGYDIYKKYYINKGANEALDEFDERINKKKSSNTIGNFQFDLNGLQTEESDSSDKRLAKQTYKGFTVLGKIEIPVINLKLPILDRATKASMEASVGVSYGPGPNKVGNTVIAGHNYRNGTFFSKLDQVKEGDKIYITDLEGLRLKYIVYNVYTTSASDFDYASRDTAGKREISLSTCTDDADSRTIIWAREAENQVEGENTENQ